MNVPLSAAVLGASLVAHAIAYVALGAVNIPLLALTQRPVSLELIEPEPVPEPEPEPIPEEIAEPELPAPEPPPRPAAVEPEPEPEPEAEPPPPAEEVPVSFDNVVLTNEGSTSGFSMPQASGIESDQPIGPPGQVTGRRRIGALNGTPGGTGVPGGTGPVVVALSDLSRRPAPPGNLNSLLESNYPREARQQGIEGTATVRIRVNASGSITVLGQQSETHPGFGEACMRTLRASPAWTPPLDSDGDPVATVTRFVCTFEVRY